MCFRKIVSIFAAMVFCLGMVACGADGEAPENTVKNFLQGMAKFDPQAAEYLSEANREMFRQQLKAISSFMGDEIKKTEIDISGLKYELVDRADNNARVKVSGTVHIKSPQGEDTDNMDEMFVLVKENGSWVIDEQNMF